jgi:hypothetical protein
MSDKVLFNQRPLLALLSATLLMIALPGCQTVETAPADTRLSGSWRLDAAASDDPDAKIGHATSVAQAKLRKALSRYGYGPDSADRDMPPSDSSSDAPDYSYDTPGDRYGGPGRVGPDFRGLKTRLHQALTPPTELRLAVDGDLVTITDEPLPPRDYRLNERLSRFDEYGSASITTTWAHDQFVLKSKYSSHASRTETYQVDPASGQLILTQLFVDPTVGKITIRSVYRRS